MHRVQHTECVHLLEVVRVNIGETENQKCTQRLLIDHGQLGALNSNSLARRIYLTMIKSFIDDRSVDLVFHAAQTQLKYSMHFLLQISIIN